MKLSSCCSYRPINRLKEEFTEEEKQSYLEQFWLGVITKETLDLAYHERVAKTLLDPVLEHLGDPFGPQDELRNVVSREFRQSVFEFSAAKQYSQARELSRLITPDIMFPGFRQKADEVFDLYNVTYLRTEFDTAVASSQSALQYVDAIETTEDFPLVQYKTQFDGRVRPAHSALHNITLPVNHPFWRRYWPPNGWNCRCFTVKLLSGEPTDLSTIDIGEIRANTPGLFRQNSALTGQLFDKTKHPYFEVARGDSVLREQNFGLPRG